MIKLIINADDFGYSHIVNMAIVQAMRDKLISSTTLMSNMDGFEEACSLSKQELFRDKVGIHLNLWEGSPLTMEMKECPIYCNKEGFFHRQNISFFSPLKASKIVYNEMYEQIKKVIDSGISPTHLDSHVHRHTNFFVGRQVIELAKHFNIPAIRINNNLRDLTIHRKILVYIYNYRLSLSGIAHTQYMGSITDFSTYKKKVNKVVEIMTHPTYDQDTKLIDAEFKNDLNELLEVFSCYPKDSFRYLSKKNK